MTIEETIIKPLQDSIDGTGQLMRFPMTQAVREVVRHGDAAELHRQMEPFYEMWIEDSPRLDWTSRIVISDIAQIDPMFGEWASRQDLMKMARAHKGSDPMCYAASSAFRICSNMCSKRFLSLSNSLINQFFVLTKSFEIESNLMEKSEIFASKVWRMTKKITIFAWLIITIRHEIFRLVGL